MTMPTVEKNSVFIADIKTILPKLYKSEEILQDVYCREGHGVSPVIANRIVNRINIQYRPLIIDPAKLPEKQLLRESDSALNWGVQLVEALTTKISKDDVGFFGLGYNVSSSENTLPNLSSQILRITNLKPDVLPDERISYGCASGIFALKRAMQYCQDNNKAAMVYIFDQCSWAANIILDTKDPEFKNSFINSLIFGDGGVGILLIPSSMRSQFNGSLPEIKEIIEAFEPTDTMQFDETGIKLNDKIHKIIPEMACSRIIRPLLESHKLKPEDIKEWSFHQGGIPILNEFKDKSVLGLSEEAITPSRELYLKYGNLSSASVFFVLAHHFNNSETSGNKGIATSFGSGFYLGGFLYEKR